VTAFLSSSVSGGFATALSGSHLRVAAPPHTLIFVGGRPVS